MNLLVDAGNSRIKWLCRGAGAPGSRGEHPSTAEDLDRGLAGHWIALERPRAVWACSVAGSRAADAVERVARQHWALEVHWVRASASALGVQCAYARPQALGADRWAALIGARQRTTGPLCILDCGTAITLDALDADGNHLGGLIVTGVELARDSLSRRAPGIPPARGEGGTLFATTTADAVAAGAVHAAAALADRFVAAVNARESAPATCLVTGGDGERIAAHMRSCCQSCPDLVLEGLARFAEAAP